MKSSKQKLAYQAEYQKRPENVEKRVDRNRVRRQALAAGIVKKVLESAIANAEHNEGADIDELKVTSIHVEQGPTLKRFTARAKGRGNRISKPTCHIYLTVGDEPGRARA